jgi:hypothetical protein
VFKLVDNWLREEKNR